MLFERDVKKTLDEDFEYFENLSEGLSKNYKYPVNLDRDENELLSYYYSGQRDPLYALVSRTAGGGSTKASGEEIESAIYVLNDAMEEGNLKGSEQRVAIGLIKKLKGIYKG